MANAISKSEWCENFRRQVNKTMGELEKLQVFTGYWTSQGFTDAAAQPGTISNAEASPNTATDIANAVAACNRLLNAMNGLLVSATAGTKTVLDAVRRGDLV